MYQQGNPGHYVAVGLSAMRCIQVGLAESRRVKSPRVVLDFASGYGRVLRFLKVVFPESQIVACDVDKAAVSFCQRAFSVEGVFSTPDLQQLTLPVGVDMIWCGSLITHIRERSAEALLRLFYDHLSHGGVCIFTTHGQLSADWIQSGSRDYGLTPQGCSAVLDGYYGKGYGYSDYPGRNGYGISVVTRQRIGEIASSVGDWRQTTYLHQGWGNHHDVYGFFKP